MTGADPTVHETVIDGVTALWVDAPGPLSVTLGFRVGVWDESVLTRGVTHLVEHLALHPLRRAAHPFNGSTGGNFLTFHAQGTPEELQAFFATLSANLRAIPMERIDTEAGVLHAESGEAANNWHQEILSQFFGPSGPGLHSYDERGLETLAPDDVQAWADRYCVRENALLMVAGTPPATLGIDLPAGAYQPYVLPGERAGYRPQRLERLARQTQGACMGALVERTTEAVLGLDHLHRRLTEHLRHELGLIYNVAVTYLPLDDHTAYVYLGADGRKGQVRRMARAFVEVLEACQREDPTQEELDEVRQAIERQEDTDEASRANNELGRVGWWRLLRYPAVSSEELRRERAQATPRGVGAALRAMIARAGVVLPEGVGEQLPERPELEDAPLQGTVFKRRGSTRGPVDRLVVGAEGLSMRGGGRWLSMPWETLELVEHVGEVAWRFLDERGAYMSLNVEGWRRRRKLKRLLEEHVPYAVRLPENAVRHLTSEGEDEQERAREADAVVRELRGKGFARHRIYEVLCERGFSDDEAWDALER